MGWIGGVIAANNLSSQLSGSKNNTTVSNNGSIKSFELIINKMMLDDGCKTLEDKRKFIRKLQYFNVNFGNKERQLLYKLALENLLRKIEFEIQNNYEKDNYSYIL